MKMVDSDCNKVGTIEDEQAGLDRRPMHRRNGMFLAVVFLSDDPPACRGRERATVSSP